MQHSVDLLIIGAGPAGCAAALQARQAGLSVLMIERHAQPQVAPGETLHPGVEPLFERLGVLSAVLDANFHRHEGIWMGHNGTRRFQRYGEDRHGIWRGFQVDRRILQHILQDTATRAGATLAANTQPQALLTRGQRVVGVVADGNELRARWTLDGSGRNAWLATKLGIAATRVSAPLQVRFGWRDKATRDDDTQPSFTFHKDGWYWQAPLRDRRVAWARLFINPSNRRPHGLDTTWRLRRQCAGPGFFLLGDAAAILDPASSHGVLKALMSGIYAGYLAAGAIEKRFSELEATAEYDRWLRASFAHDADRLRVSYDAVGIPILRAPAA